MGNCCESLKNGKCDMIFDPNKPPKPTKEQKAVPAHFKAHSRQIIKLQAWCRGNISRK